MFSGGDCGNEKANFKKMVDLSCLTYTVTVGSVRLKPAISPKRLKTDRAKVTINGLYKVVHGLSIAAKMYDLK